MATLLLLLLPLAQGTLVSMSLTNGLLDYQIGLADPLTGKFTKIANLSTAGYPVGSSALRNDNTVVYGAQDEKQRGVLNIVDLSTGKIQEGQPYSAYIFSNIAFDKVTKQTFVTTTVVDSLLFEFLPDQTLRKIADFPPFYITSTYSSSKHLFFLLTGEAGSVQLLAVSTVGPQEGKAIYDVQLGSLGIENLVFDDTLGRFPHHFDVSGLHHRKAHQDLLHDHLPLLCVRLCHQQRGHGHLQLSERSTEQCLRAPHSGIGHKQLHHSQC